MEKFRAFLEWLKKYHFWVLCGAIVLLSFLTWFLATSDRAKQFLACKSQIERNFNLAQAVSRNPEHPSADHIKQIRDRTSGPLSIQVAKASKRLYSEMRESNDLPEVFANKAQQDEFKAAFDKTWGPMEEMEKLPPNRQLDDLYRTHYAYHIAGHFPKLFERIERRMVVENDNSPAGNPGGGGVQPVGLGGKDGGEKPKKTVGIVDWVNAEQKIAKFCSRFQGTTPSTFDIMVAQEELWVYQSLLNVIRNTNNVGADAKHYQKPASHKMARIKQILAMDIGKDAVASWKKSERILFSLAGEGGGSAAAPAGMPQFGVQPAPNANAGNSPLADRYVDDKGNPLADPAQQPFGEFRMMPIDLKVVIEQREIPRLLAECANSAMRIDVRGVRVFAHEPPPPVDLNSDAPSGGASSGGGGPGTGGGMRGGMLPTGMGHGGGGDSEGGKGDNEESADPVYPPVPVEVQGIIYIYNPPHDQNTDDSAGGNSGVAAGGANGGTPVNGAAGMGVPTSPVIRTNPSVNTPGQGGRR